MVRNHVATHFFSIVILMLLLLLTSCGSEGVIMPQAIDEEIDVCETCYMMVSDNQFGAQIITNNGDAYKFDDVGCMAMYINDNGLDGQAYIRDFYTNEWTKVDSAYFVSTMEVETPMNYGFISFGSKENADKFLTESGGEEITWSQVLEKMKERSSHNETQHSHN